jgi:hypothetical protein
MTSRNAARTGMMIGKCKRCGSVSRMTHEEAHGGMDPMPAKCGHRVWHKHIVGSYNPDKSCDGRCMSAKRGSCDCSCGGENHGASWS